MLGSGVIDTAIGLVFVFLLVSMLVTIANEIISAVLMSRAKWLRVGIDRLIGSEWVQRLYEHPLIAGSGMTAGAKAPRWFNFRGSGPSYIPSRSFANVLLDLVRAGDTTLKTAKEKLQEVVDDTLVAVSPEELKQRVVKAADALSGATRSALAADVRRYLDKVSARTPDLGKWAGELADTAARLPNADPLKGTLVKLANESKNLPLDDLRSRLKAEFDAVPFGVVAEAVRKDLTALRERLGDGYTIGDARADIQRFIDSMPARYLREVIARLPGQPNEHLKKILLVLLDDAENDVEKFKLNVEIWFNNAMDRVGGWYKRRSQWVIAGLGVMVAVCMNVDAILVLKHLDTHPGVRDALVAQAKAFAASGAASQPTLAGSGAGSAWAAASGSSPVRATSGDAFKGAVRFEKAAAASGVVSLTSSDRIVTLREGSVPVAAGASDVKFNIDSKRLSAATTVKITASGAASGVTPVQLEPSLDAQYSAVEDKLMQLSLPIGWVRANPSQSELDNRLFLPSDWNTWWDTISFHLLGWLLTALAATLGAPFWFDTLNRFISIRSAGKAPEEKPKPPKNVPTPLEPGQSPREADLANSGKRA